MADAVSTPVRSILVKGTLPPEGAAFSLRGPGGSGTVSFTSRPLFKHIGGSQERGLAAPSTWHLLSASGDLGEANAWDICHSLLRGGFGIAGVGVPEFAEPDIAQRWTFGDDTLQARALASGCAAPAPQDPRFPTFPDPFWYRDAGHAGFSGGANDGAGVRVAHLDTGYDPAHLTRPVNLRTDLARNFVETDPQFAHDATDRTTGALTNLGHGTGTLSILAGAGANGTPPVGAAPGTEVVPVRVANSVVLFKNSAIAEALDYVYGLWDDPATRVHVVTMSMGGVASQAWADAVNALYEKGVFIVTAAGNNVGNFPTRNIVFPARFRRVVAACGVMGDLTPYADLGLGKMAGNYGPPSKMDTAIAAYTPNTPWARLGCPAIVDDNGCGTSAATPQVAAAAALWIAANKAAWEAYPEGWMRVEGVRSALFSSAADLDRAHFGRGTLHSGAALAVPAPAAATLQKQDEDDASFPLWRILTGLGLRAAPAGRAQRMLELEALQLSQSAAIEQLLPDTAPGAPQPTRAQLRALAQALARHPNASKALVAALASYLDPNAPPPSPSPLGGHLPDAVERLHIAQATNPSVPKPERRSLRVYAFDPAMELSLDTLAFNEALVDVRWEELEPGPVGEYIEVVDADPPSGACYAPVDLDHPYLLVRDGLAPSEANAQFHQQMVYAVSMKTIEYFERALGRVALWSPHFATEQGKLVARFVRRLRIYPHALREANAFYSPQKKALLFGYFPAPQEAGVNAPGALVFACLSHDIVAHETTHALLDGLHRRYIEPTNADMLAFHEAFADIVAIFQHFTIPEALHDAIAKTRGDLGQENPLVDLAFQFGQAMGSLGALRSALGVSVAGKPVSTAASRSDYTSVFEPHDRGSVLVAAVFDAFLQIYRIRSADLIRLATGGTGVLPPGNIPSDLVQRLAKEASKVAAQWLNICIRALDYCPPVDITFGDYLRALITADRDLVPDDKRSYRVAFVDAFRAHGIFADGVRHISVESLAWEPPPQPLADIKWILGQMTLTWDLRIDREQAYETSRENAVKVHAWLLSSRVSDAEISALGLFRGTVQRTFGGVEGTIDKIEVHSVRPARRIGPDGQMQSDLVIEITQIWRPLDPGERPIRGGVTLLVDLATNQVRYFIRKRLDKAQRYSDQVAFADTLARTTLRAAYFSDPLGREPFAIVHRMAGQPQEAK
jgi:hypothetical protein